MIIRLSSSKCLNRRGRYVHYAAEVEYDSIDDRHCDGKNIQSIYALARISRYQSLLEIANDNPEWDRPIHMAITIADCHVIRDAMIQARIDHIPGVMHIRRCLMMGKSFLDER
jgi:hypothetical protein